MANRYPLVVDTSDNNQIKEIPSGDNLLLTGNSITGVVDITASGSISGADVNITGDLTYKGTVLNNIASSGAYSDLTGAPTLLSQFANDLNFRSNGDNISVFTNDAGYLTTVSFNDLTGKPTTLGGYGIIDAASSVQGSLATSALQPGANISTLNNDSGFVTLTQLTDGTVTVDVNNSGDLVGSVFADDSTVMIDSMLGAVNLDGTIRGNVVPNTNQHNTWDLGTNAVRFKDAYFAGTINGALVGTLDGDVEGSVFGDDSTLLVDGNNNKIVGPVETYNLRTTNPTIALGYLAGQTDQENSSVAIGDRAGNNAQAAGSVGIGYKAGNDTQGGGAIAIGYQSGQTTQGGQAIAIGELAGQATQGGHGIALGYASGQTAQSAYAIALGYQSAYTTQGSAGIAIGYQSGQSDQGASATAIGYGAGNDTQGDSAVALGSGAGNTYQGAKAIAIGYNAGNSGQAANSIVINASSTTLENPTASSLRIKPIRSAVGTTMLMYDAGTGEVTHTASPVITGDITGSVFGDDSTVLVDGNNNKIVGAVETSSLRTSETKIALGSSAGVTTQGIEAIAIGKEAGKNTQGDDAVAVGSEAGEITQGIQAVAIGKQAGNSSQSADAVAVGYAAGKLYQGIEAIALGKTAGYDNQGDNAVAVGYGAGSFTQGDNATALGFSAGYTGQGADAIAIGRNAGYSNQAANSIVINATGNILTEAGANTFVVTPIRGGSGTTTLMYDASSGEITHTATPAQQTMIGSVQQISGPGAIDVTSYITEITTTGNNDAYTLADGVAGQIKIISMVVDGGDAIITPTTLATGTTITMADVNDNITLLYGTNGWVNTANQGSIIA